MGLQHWSVRSERKCDSVGAAPAPLRQLLDALQLAPLTDDAYRRLWFLRLHDRCRRFLHSCGLKIEEEQAFKKVNDHRHAIAHEGVERIDLRLLEELQQNCLRSYSAEPIGGRTKVVDRLKTLVERLGFDPRSNLARFLSMEGPGARADAIRELPPNVRPRPSRAAPGELSTRYKRIAEQLDRTVAAAIRR